MFEIPAMGYAHMLGGAIASLIGPFQFVKSIRRRYPRWHVWMGRVYLTCVAAGALAVAWLYTGRRLT
jgi:hypothetical protein